MGKSYNDSLNLGTHATIFLTGRSLERLNRTVLSGVHSTKNLHSFMSTRKVYRFFRSNFRIISEKSRRVSEKSKLQSSACLKPNRFIRVIPKRLCLYLFFFYFFLSPCPQFHKVGKKLTSLQTIWSVCQQTLIIKNNNNK